MEPLLSHLSLRAASVAVAPAKHMQAPSSTASCRVRCHSGHATFRPLRRTFTTTARRCVKVKDDQAFTKGTDDSSYSQPASNVSQNISTEEKDHFQQVEKASKKKQIRSPWTREGSDLPPVARNRSAGAMVKGKLLTTPSRMLKLILPLTTRDHNNDRKDVEPLALLVHPQQPLSYLERLIQSEVPMLEESGKPPSVTFRAEDSMEENVGSKKSAVQELREDEGAEANDDLAEDADEIMVDGKRERTGKIGNRNKDSTTAAEAADKDLPAHGHEDAPADIAEQEDQDHPNFVRWSPSTEIGDFIRDAAHGKEFAVDIEGNSTPIYVGVPSFADRTYYLRMRLRKTAQRISDLADVKRTCDELAHRGAKRMAQMGFGGLLGWWAVVYYLTFRTDLGWDVMEPVTYLVGLSGLIGGYMWFLYHNREVSYKSAMHFTVSRRQNQLYQVKGFDLPHWEGLIEEGNRLRREVKLIADEYDTEWDESHDEGDEKVKEALRKGRKKKNGDEEKKKEKEEDDDDD
nr:calcium uniporter protein, mitochondrial [Quercus suber]